MEPLVVHVSIKLILFNSRRRIVVEFTVIISKGRENKSVREVPSQGLDDLVMSLQEQPVKIK